MLILLRIGQKHEGEKLSIEALAVERFHGNTPGFAKPPSLPGWPALCGIPTRPANPADMTAFSQPAPVDSAFLRRITR